MVEPVVMISSMTMPEEFLISVELTFDDAVVRIEDVWYRCDGTAFRLWISGEVQRAIDRDLPVVVGYCADLGVHRSDDDWPICLNDLKRFRVSDFYAWVYPDAERA